MAQTLTLRRIEPVTHDTYHLTFGRPEGLTWTPGQAMELAIDRDGWREEGRPFTMTTAPEGDEMDFVIKVYPDHEDGMTKHLPGLTAGDTVLADGPFGAIEDKGPGIFVAGGAGITPFIPILRARAKSDDLGDCTLIYSNKTERDIILREEWDRMTGLRTIYSVTDQTEPAGEDVVPGFVDDSFMKSHVGPEAERVYICGPQPMVNSVREAAKAIGVADEKIITEEGW